MLQILILTFPFFGLVLCGYAAARTRFMPLTAIPGLNVFVLYFALPAMLFRFSAGSPFERLLDASTILTYLFAALAVVGITIAVTRKGAIGWNDASFGALVAAFPNTGFMGMPLLSSLVGGAVMAPVVSTLVVDIMVTTSLCIGLSRIGSAGSQGVRSSMKKAFHGAFMNPLPWAIIAGGSLSYTHFTLYAPVFKIIEMLADAGSPTALFTIGAIIARSRLRTIESGQKAFRMRDVPQVVLIKLVLHPALVFGLGTLAILGGLPLDPAALTTLTLVAALPGASSITMISERYGADTGRIAQVVMLSTALAFLSFSATANLVL